MKAILRKASDYWRFKKEIEINTLEDLLQLMKEYNHSLIIHENCGAEGDCVNTYEIIIYDDYVE